jgi:hypothetical protein
MKLHVVKQPPEPVKDITLELRAEIMKRDWAAVHVSGDRRSAVCMAERVKRVWRG